MLRNSAVLVLLAGLGIATAGCASAPRLRRQDPLDYGAWTCAALAKEASRLARQRFGKEDFLLAEGRKAEDARRAQVKSRLKQVEKAARDRGCPGRW
jgi:hypothetical protein